MLILHQLHAENEMLKRIGFIAVLVIFGFVSPVFAQETERSFEEKYITAKGFAKVMRDRRLISLIEVKHLSRVFECKKLIEKRGKEADIHNYDAYIYQIEGYVYVDFVNRYENVKYLELGLAVCEFDLENKSAAVAFGEEALPGHEKRQKKLDQEKRK